jgi:hypothetical protein
VNVEITGVTDHDRPRPDYRDYLTVFLVTGGFIASWVYVFMHPSPEAFGICIGGVGAFSSLFHLIAVRDDKTPDAR